METLLIGMRFVQFVAVMILFGSSLFPCYALYGNQTKTVRYTVEDFIQKAAFFASLAVLVSAIGWLECEATLMSGHANGYREAATLLTVLDNTQFGRVWRWRLVLMALLPIVLGWQIKSKRKPLILPVLICGALLVISLAGIGHGAMGVGFDAWIHLGNQAIHLLAVSIWVGGLLPLFYVTRSKRGLELEPKILVDVLKRFSRIGLVAVVFILGSGLLNSWFLVGSMHALVYTHYGHVLCVKLFLFLCMISVALFNRLFLMPMLTRPNQAEKSLQLLLRSVALEYGFAVLTVAAVSLLGMLPPAFDMPGINM